jgi:pyruvate kinase
MLRTKIICTLGPATSDREVIGEMVRRGMDVARLNMAHGDRASHRQMIESVRAASEAEGRPISVLADLSGPKIRVGSLAEPIALRPGDEITMTFQERAQPGQIPTRYAGLFQDLARGARVAIDDGLIELDCQEADGEEAVFEVRRGGVVRSNQGINVPTGLLSTPSLTPKDLEDLDFVLDQQVEHIGMSFVRTGSDVAQLKDRLEGRALVVAKIEMARAVASIDDILAASDMVMVARGDLGVELPFEEVPLAQKRIIQKANFHVRPVITATQMLESMIGHSRPTRAEASDVANAVLDGTDAVMLSGETAMGRYPLLALDAIARIVREIEASGVLAAGPRYLGDPTHQDRTGASPTEHAIALGTVDATRHLSAPAVLVLTSSGFSARLVSSHRPPVPIFAVTTDPRTRSQLAAVWGVEPVLAPKEGVSYKSLTDFGKKAILESGIGSPGQSVVVTAGVPFHRPGTTNTLRVERL